MSDVTYSVKGFVGYGALIDNTRDTIAPLGELSAYARTFNTDRYLYSTEAETNPNSTVDLTIFSSVQADGSIRELPPPISNILLEISAWSYRQALLGTFTNDVNTYRLALLGEFADKLIDVTVGAMVTNGTIYLPGAVTFTLVPDELSGVWGSGVKEAIGDTPRMKLWFSDDRFRREYDEYSYVFIAPLDNLDDFFLPPATVRDKVNERSFPALTQIIRDKTDKKPTTVLRADEFAYVDPTDPTFTFPTTWTYLIYGAAGDNIDAIKEELIEWILDNSEHTREEWAEILPDLFTATEFIVVPTWNQFSVENTPIKAGVYSPIVNMNQARVVGHAAFTGTGYNENHIDDNMSVTGIPFKSIALLICGGPENREGKSRFEQHWPDYMNVSTTHSDFGRMSLETQGLVLLLEEMLYTAETMTEFSDIPSTMTRLKRTNSEGQEFLYLVKSYENVQYLVAAASTLTQHFPPVTYQDLDVSNEDAEGMIAMPNGTGAVPYETFFTATGGTGLYTFELVDPQNSVILAQSIDELTGIYTATFDWAGGDTTVTVRVRDSSNAYVQKTFTLHVIAGEEPDNP